MATDRELIREWYRKMALANEASLEERRSATISERWHRIYLVEELRKGLGATHSPREDSVVRERWLRLKRKYHG